VSGNRIQRRPPQTNQNNRNKQTNRNRSNHRANQVGGPNRTNKNNKVGQSQSNPQSRTDSANVSRQEASGAKLSIENSPNQSSPNFVNAGNSGKEPSGNAQGQPPSSTPPGYQPNPESSTSPASYPASVTNPQPGSGASPEAGSGTPDKANEPKATSEAPKNESQTDKPADSKAPGDDKQAQGPKSETEFKGVNPLGKIEGEKYQGESTLPDSFWNDVIFADDSKREKALEKYIQDKGLSGEQADFFRQVSRSTKHGPVPEGATTVKPVTNNGGSSGSGGANNQKPITPTPAPADTTGLKTCTQTDVNDQSSKLKITTENEKNPGASLETNVNAGKDGSVQVNTEKTPEGLETKARAANSDQSAVTEIERLATQGQTVETIKDADAQKNMTVNSTPETVNTVNPGTSGTPPVTTTTDTSEKDGFLERLGKGVDNAAKWIIGASDPVARCVQMRGEEVRVEKGPQEQSTVSVVRDGNRVVIQQNAGDTDDGFHERAGRHVDNAVDAGVQGAKTVVKTAKNLGQDISESVQAVRSGDWVWPWDSRAKWWGQGRD